MRDHTPDKLEQRIRFVTRHYVPDALNTEKAWIRFVGIQSAERSTSNRRKWIGIAASLLLLISSGAWWLASLARHDWKYYEASNGKTVELWLPDSTRVTLAPYATLRYDRKNYGVASRPVALKGKAFFDVRRNPDAPFSVETPLADVTVLGTSFQVNDRKEEVSVDVITGKVRFAIHNVEEEAILQAGMSGIYTAGNQQLKVKEEGNLNEIAWKTKELHFRDTPLPEVIRTLENYYNCKITLATPESAAKLKLTATLRDLSLREALVIINKTLGIRLTAKPAPTTKP